ncbi:MAG: cytochrome c peroxidase [Bacteroidota bacterium]
MRKYLSIVFILLVALNACHKETPITEVSLMPGDKYAPTPYTIHVPAYFPTQMNIPADNPITVEGVYLGRCLFYDGRFGGRTDADSLMSCSSCHVQESAFVCGLANPSFPGGMPHGITGIPTPHAMMTLCNVVFNSNGYLWNGLIDPLNPNPKKRRLEDLVWMGIYAPHEMHSDSNKSLQVIRSIPGYKPLFKAAFGSDTITFELMAKAISQFIRTLVSSDSKFDRYLQGSATLTSSELNGYVLFVTEQGADCFHCHGGSGNPLFTTNLYYNNAKDSAFSDTRDRYAVTGNAMDIGAYRAPSLRNVELLAPYMHDGRFTTLEQVIDFYSNGLVWSPSVSPLMHKLSDGGAQLTPAEKADLKAFLLTLTDQTFLTNPAFGPPPSLP